MDSRSSRKSEETTIIKRQPIIRKHKATVFMLLGNPRSYLKGNSGYDDSDKLFVIKTKYEFSGREWAELMVRIQKELDKMTGDLVSGLGCPSE